MKVSNIVVTTNLFWAIQMCYKNHAT